ncbi:MAG: hypothetical protein J1F63_09800 [Oscillospiraceae bacterium]|nr:hypothetical protein [Oscillospiraceae bacterium]
MPVVIENLICFLGLTLCVLPGVAQSPALLAAIFILFCLGQIPVVEMLYGKMKVKSILAYESVYLMANFLLALIFRLVVWGSVLESRSGARAAFMLYVVFSVVHWVYMIIRLCIKRHSEGPPPINPEDLRYGLIRDEDVEDTM